MRRILDAIKAAALTAWQKIKGIALYVKTQLVTQLSEAQKLRMTHYKAKCGAAAVVFVAADCANRSVPFTILWYISVGVGIGATIYMMAVEGR